MRYWKTRNNIPSSTKVGMVLVTYNQTDCLASLIYSFKAQTFKNFKIYIIHDGPWLPEVLNFCLLVVGEDSKFEISCSDVRINKYGHNLRQIGFDKAYADGCTWVGTTNGDNFYSPVYFEWMLSDAIEENANFVYCNMVHSHKEWAFFNVLLGSCNIDAGSFLVSSSLSSLVKFDSLESLGDWIFVEKLMKLIEFKPTKVKGVLFMHN